MKTTPSFSWRTLAMFMLCLAAFVSFHYSASVQTPETTTPTPEVEQLKKRLQQLEQTVLELKTQLGAIEEKNKASVPSIVEASMVAFLDHNWSKRFSTAVGYSMLDIDNSNGQAPNAFHRGHYGLANLLFYPTDRAMVGGEFQWGRRENFWTASSPTLSAASFPFATTFRSYSHIDA